MEARWPWRAGSCSRATVDGRFLALDAKTGTELWSFDNQAATLAGPISYEVDGEQYVAVPAGYGTAFFLINGFFAPRAGAPVTARVYAFKLGGAAPKPRIDFARVPTPRPPVLRVTADQYQRGAQLYEDYCLTCHGIAAITGGVLPDLRKSAPAAERRPVETGGRRCRTLGTGDAAVRAVRDARRMRS